jgi:hypothetical protein
VGKEAVATLKGCRSELRAPTGSKAGLGGFGQRNYWRHKTAVLISNKAPQAMDAAAPTA